MPRGSSTLNAEFNWNLTLISLAEQLEQTAILLQDLGRSPRQVVVDLGFRGVDAANPGVEIIHRGRYKTLTREQKRWLKRR